MASYFFFFRGAQCCYQLKRYSDWIKWAKKALELEADDNEIKTILSMFLLDTQLLLFIMEFVHEFTKNDRVTVIHRSAVCMTHFNPLG